MSEMVVASDGFEHEVGITTVAECFDCGATATASTADGAKRLLRHGRHRFEKKGPYWGPRRLMTEAEIENAEES